MGEATGARAREWAAAAAFGLLAAACLAPWPRPSLDLRQACALENSGRFGAQCDLSPVEQRPGLAWAGRSVRVYEDALPLRDVASRGEVRRSGAGAYHTDGSLLTFSSLDGSDPLSNGRSYWLRSAFGWDELAMGDRWRAWAGAAVAVAFLGLGWLWRERLSPFVLAATSAVAAAGLAVQVVAVLREAPVHVDAGASLPSAEAIAGGAVPYVTLLFNYTPLGLYELGLWSRFWPLAGPPPHAWYLGFVLLNEAACALLVALIARRAGARRDLALATALSFLSMTLWFDGHRILFEPLYLVPVLTAAWLALGRASTSRLAAGGGLSAVAFLVKQYGGFGLWGLLGATLVDGAGRLRRALVVGAAFAASLVAIGLVLALSGVDLLRLAAQVGGSDYARRYEAVWLKLFLWSCPLALLAVLTPFLPGAWAERGVRVLVAFLLASCLPLYFRQHQYYFLNLCPWVFALFAAGIEIAGRGEARWRRLAIPVAALLLTSVPVRAALAQGPLLMQERRSEQYRRGRLMTQAWPAERRTLLLLHHGFYHVTRYRSVDEAALGYRFAYECNADQLRLAFRRAEGVWIDRDTMFTRRVDGTLQRAGSSVAEQLTRNGFEKRQVLENRFELWARAEGP